jgi:DNA-binding GntR family transcriptional regulator
MSRTPNPSQTHDVYERLRADLLACRYPPGERLMIPKLREQLSANQAAVREALARLTSEGLVEAEPQRGYRVMTVSSDELLHLTAARADIESLCLRRSITLGDIDWESRIVSCFHRLAHTPQIDADNPHRFSAAFIAAHTEFLDALVSACDNPWLSRLRTMLCVQGQRYRGLAEPLGRDIVGEMRAIMDAALARDADQATKLLTGLMLETAQTMIDAVESVKAAQN